MADCEDDIHFEPFNSFAPFMPKTHQKVVLLVERLGLNQRLMSSIEQKLFTLRGKDSVPLQSIVNWTYLYLTLQDLQINKSPGDTRPLRLFIVKALYYLKRRSIAIVYMTLKAFPKLLPRLQKQPFVVGAHADPLVDVILCVLMNSAELQRAQPAVNSGRMDCESNKLRKFRADWKKEQHFHYGFTPDQPSTADVTAMLLERLKSPQRSQNVVQGLLVLAKQMDVPWTRDELLQKELMPRVQNLMAEQQQLPPTLAWELSQYLTVIAGAVKVFPKTENVSVYRDVFRRVLVERERFPLAVQESAVVSILRLASFGVEPTFDAVKDWYAPPECISPQLRAVMETFVRRGKAQHWVHLSNQG